MRILYWAPYTGHVGTIKAVVNSAAAMRQYGNHDVTLVKNHSEWEGFEDRIRNAGVRMVDFGLKRRFPKLRRTGPFGSRLYMIAVALFGFFQLVSYLRRHPTDVLIANLVAVPAILSTRLLQRRPRIVVSIQGFPKFLGIRQDDYPWWMKIEDACRRWLWNHVYIYADLLVCMTESTKQKLIHQTVLPAERFTVINNPVVDDDIYSMAQQTIDDPWFFVAECKRVIAIGRLTPQKDLPTLITAAALASKRVKFRLAIFGEGTERSRLQQEIERFGLQDFVRLYGFINNPYAYLKRADLFVLTSRWEDPGHGILEAAALRVPILSTDCPSGPAALLSNGNGGELCPVGDVACLGNKLAAMLCSAYAETKLQVAYENAQQFSVRSHYDAYRPHLTRWTSTAS
jgi:glycosyltransferase involved in cell wall biosynthesis